jgi:hypothetical protein
MLFSMPEKFLFTLKLFYRKGFNYGYLEAKGGLGCCLDPILLFCLLAKIGGLPDGAPYPKYDFCSGFGAKLLKLNSFYAIGFYL